MKLRIWTTLFSLTVAQLAWGQTSGNSKLVNTEGTAPETSATSYTVIGATPKQEALVRAQIQVMQPDVYPLRVLFVPHWKYIETARIFRLHVPAGYTSAMFTHLPSRSVFIDSDRYVSDNSLGYWVGMNSDTWLPTAPERAMQTRQPVSIASALRTHTNRTRIEGERAVSGVTPRCGPCGIA